jgi:hypothetical protein
VTGDRSDWLEEEREEQTADGIQLVPRENGEDEGRRRRRGGLGDDAKHIHVPGYDQPVPPGQKPFRPSKIRMKLAFMPIKLLKLYYHAPLFIDVGHLETN